MNNILVEFDLLIDKDFGLIQLIKDQYSNNDFIDDIILKMKDKVLIWELINRKDKNPLSIVLKKEYKDSMDNLYREFIESEYKSILDFSISTSLLDLMITYLNANICSITVICKNKLEEQIINKYKLKTIICDDFSKLNIEEFDSIYIKDYSKVTQFKNLKAKNIFIANYKFNLENDEYTPINDVSIFVSDINIVSVIDVYNSDKYIKLEG